jgi:hypothetical protein
LEYSFSCVVISGIGPRSWGTICAPGTVGRWVFCRPQTSSSLSLGVLGVYHCRFLPLHGHLGSHPSPSTWMGMWTEVAEGSPGFRLKDKIDRQETA